MSLTLTYGALVGMMPLDRIVEALDDDRDGEADASAWAEVLKAVDERLADILGSDPDAAAAGASTARAVKVFACELLYLRRGISGPANPWTEEAGAIDKRLRKHATGEERANPPGDGGTTITMPAQTYVSGGGLLT